jgi:zinc transporter ZupT
MSVFVLVILVMHKVLEAIAVDIVLMPKKVPKTTLAIWRVVTLLSQALMEALAFMCVHPFLPPLSVELGFAEGCL